MEQTKYYVQKNIISTNFNEGVLSAFDLGAGIGSFLNSISGRIAHELGKKKSQVKVKRIVFNSDKKFFDCDVEVTEKFPQDKIEEAFRTALLEKYDATLKEIYFESGFDYNIIVEITVSEKYREQFSTELGKMQVKHDLQDAYKGLYGPIYVQVYKFV